jgi:hypothetical protein
MQLFGIYRKSFFQQEIKDLLKGNPVNRKSRLAMLNPVMKIGLIGMSGRHINTDYEKAPIITMKKPL